MKLLSSLVIFTLILITNPAISQEEDIQINNFLGFGIQYGFDIPAADLSDRFGNSFHISTSLDFYNSKWNGMWGFEYSLQFGTKVNEDVVESIRSSTGAVLGFDGGIADVFLRRRGNYVGMYINKTLIKSKKSPASGLNLGLGAGLLQHKIRLQDDTNNANQLRGDYEKGYDRLTRGPALKQSLTYLHLGNNRSVNYSVGISAIEGFTESVRSINFDTGLSAKGSRLDILISLDAKWFIPLKSSSDSKEIYY